MEMEKERLFGIDDGFSEKQIDLAVGKQRNNDQVKAGSIFDPQKKKVSKVSQVPKVSRG